MQLSKILIPLCILGVTQVASAASYRIDFSGTFVNDCIDCGSYATGDLRGTDFSGHIIIPDSGTPEPDEYPWGHQGQTVYFFDSSQTYFELDTVDDRFDVSSGLDMSVFVLDDDCLFTCQDSFTFYFQTDDWFFDIGFRRNTPTDPLSGEEMPTLTELQQLTLPDDGLSVPSNYFYVGAPPFDGWLGNVNDSDINDYNILDVSVTLVPVPAAAWLFMSGLGLLGLRKRARVKEQKPGYLSGQKPENLLLVQ